MESGQAMIPELIEVAWLDSHSQSDWRGYAELVKAMGAHPLLCKSVGYLVLATEDRLVIVQSLSWSDESSDTLELADSALIIPRVAVVSVRRVT